MLKRDFLFKGWLAVSLAALTLSFLASCGTNDTVNPTGSNVQLQVLNLSPDAYPIELYLDINRVNTAYRYGSAPAYFYLPRTDLPLQIRSTRVNADPPVFSQDTINFLPNTRYTLFFTGLYSDKSLRSIVTVDDTEPLPEIGKGGKIRFVNASLPQSATGFDIWVNGVPAIKNTKFGSVSDYVTLSPGNYNFRVYPANTSTNSLIELPNITIQDGRLYTLYSQGIVGRATSDTAAFRLGVLANNPPIRR
jgi:hypothetical protein